MELTIEELAAAGGVSTRFVRSLQTAGLVDHPDLRGRTGVYSEVHLDRLRAVLRLQEQGFSLRSLSALFGALERGQTLAAVLGLEGGHGRGGTGDDEAELYGFAELQRTAGPRRVNGRPLLAVVPSTVWDQTEAS